MGLDIAASFSIKLIEEPWRKALAINAELDIEPDKLVPAIVFQLKLNRT